MSRLDERSKEDKNGKEEQPMYDSTMRTNKSLIGETPKPDEPTIKNMMTEIKNKCNNLCDLSVGRQGKLEEALLFSSQFKDALKQIEEPHYILLEQLSDAETKLRFTGPFPEDEVASLGLQG